MIAVVGFGNIEGDLSSLLHKDVPKLWADDIVADLAKIAGDCIDLAWCSQTNRLRSGISDVHSNVVCGYELPIAVMNVKISVRSERANTKM